MEQHTSLVPDFAIPGKYKYLYVEVSADVDLAATGTEKQTTFRLSLLDKKNDSRNYLYWVNRDIVLMTQGDYIPKQWNHISMNDRFTLDEYRNYKNLIFELALYNQKVPLNLKMKQLKVAIYGIQ